jgi:hypothetical protein
MRGHLLLISDQPEDFKYFQSLCVSVNLELTRSMTPEEVRYFLIKGLKYVLFFDADNFFIYEQVSKIINKYSDANRIVAKTATSFLSNDYLAKYPNVGSHFLRVNNSLTRSLYPKIVDALLQGESSGLEAFFPSGTEIRSIPIHRTKHKFAAIEAIQKVMKSKGIAERIAALIAQSTDELILNALLWAPGDSAGLSDLKRESLAKNADTLLQGKDQIEIRLGATSDYMAICVRDLHGSLTRKTLNLSLAKASSPGSGGIGLTRILKRGISLLIVSLPKQYTEVTLFFKTAESYRDFKLDSFHFMSTILPP